MTSKRITLYTDASVQDASIPQAQYVAGLCAVIAYPGTPTHHVFGRTLVTSVHHAELRAVLLGLEQINQSPKTYKVKAYLDSSTAFYWLLGKKSPPCEIAPCLEAICEIETRWKVEYNLIDRRSCPHAVSADNLARYALSHVNAWQFREV